MTELALRGRRGAAVLALLALAAAAAGTLRSQGAAAGPLQSQAEAILPNPEDWSVMAWSVDRRQTLFAVHAHDVRIPASNNKVFTSIWAMDVLGPDYRFPTDLLVAGDVGPDGTLQGDVVLRGSGDPAFGYPAYEDDPLDSLRGMARALRALGVRRVQGSVVADATVFDTLMYGPDWPRDTGNGVSAYAPTVSGLAYQRNLVHVEVTPQGLTTEPLVPEIPLVDQTGRGGQGYAVRKPGEDTVYVRGPRGGSAPRIYKVGVSDPAVMGAAALRQALREEGIDVPGPAVRGQVPEGARLVHRHYSIPLRQIVPQLNQESDNFFAEHLWKAAAARALGEGSYPRGGPASALFFHQRAHVPFGELWQADGSGLSSQNRASAFSLVSALAYAHGRPWSEAFHESLALGGDPDGTLRRLFNSGPAEGNLHAKTGYIRGVRTLSGYVRTRDGELVAFSFLYNGRNTSGARGVQTQLGNLIAEWAR